MRAIHATFNACNGFYCWPFIKSSYFAHASVLDEAIKACASLRYNLSVAELRKVICTLASIIRAREELNCICAITAWLKPISIQTDSKFLTRPTYVITSAARKTIYVTNTFTLDLTRKCREVFSFLILMSF